MMISSLLDIESVAGYLRRIGAEPRSLRTAVVREMSGAYWRDVGVVRFGEGGEVDAPDGLEPTEAEAAAIRAGCTGVEWPKLKLLKRLGELPPEFSAVPEEDRFEFWNGEGELVMLQIKKKVKGGKSYIPFTFWTDGQWRKMEPEGLLPLWGLKGVKDAATVFIHEGAAAARHVTWMIERGSRAAQEAFEACPWAEELSGAAHVGWIGGALSPARTDWGALKRAGVKRAYIVSDNDAAGKAAVPAIAERLRFTTFHLQFTADWPGSFDLGDAWPRAMFRAMEGVRYYVGPGFRSCLHPATWATDLVKNKKGKPTPQLRDCFKEMWAYVEEADLFVCTEMPEIVRAEAILNKMLAPFSHVAETSRLIVREYTGRTTKLCYRPDNPGRIIANKSSASINLHIPSGVKRGRGSVGPWNSFLEYMFPIEEEREGMKRWCATLIARPEVRMEYGILLASEKQGVGKSTLGSFVLAPLVGEGNASWPGESDIVSSDFNGWLAHKRLAIINEIYSGHSWKAYNRLKNYITDKDVSVNQKFQRSYVIENWCHMFACSNSLSALKIEDDDRRWFYPEVTEKKWEREKFVEFYSWLQSGGLQIIQAWAEDWKGWVVPGERAPMTVRKRDLIEGSRTEAQKEAADLARAMNAEGRGAVALAMKDVEQYVKMAVRGRVFDTDYDLRKAMKEAGAVPLKKRLFVGGRLQYVILNRELADACRVDGVETGELVMNGLRRASDVLPLGV